MQNTKIISYVFLVSCLMANAFADNSAGDPTIPELVSQLFETVKKRAHGAVEWTAKQCGEAKVKMQEGCEHVATRGKQFASEINEVVGKHFGAKRVRAHDGDAPQPYRRPFDEPQEHEMVELELPDGFGEDAQPIGEQATTRASQLEGADLFLEQAEIVPEDLAQESSFFEWLSSDQAKLYGKGALALVTIGGITYVLYKNRVPQRITRAATKTPFRAFITTVCLCGAALYYAQQQGIKLGDFANVFAPPCP